MLRKKVCLLGTSAVGKTSLVRRYVEGLFSDRYLTTIGVKISQKTVPVEGEPVELLLWDLNGDDQFQRVSTQYLRGASGYLLVIDGTRRPTLEAALTLQHRVAAALGQIPFVTALNKGDLTDDWELPPAEVEALRAQGWTVMETSAKEGTGVDEVFGALTHQLLQR